MFPRTLTTLAMGVLFACASARAEENVWPIYVKRADSAAGVESTQAIGPLIFDHDGAVKEWGFRPVLMTTEAGNTKDGNFLYPFFTWHQEPGYRTFSFFQLVNLRSTDDPGNVGDHHFDVWPLYFSRDSGDPATSYRALVPIGGTIKNRFGKEELRFVLLPLYLHTLKNGKEITHAPWPFLRFIRGGGHHGFEFWPLFGRSERAGDYKRQFYLWPFGYKVETNLSAPQPDVKLGILPFYARDESPGYKSETYAWPFFGYSDRTQPYRYHETRYFWPLFVQGSGDQREVNRWAPFYTHSNIKGYDKTWLMWPIYRHLHYQADGLDQKRDQLLFFLYWSLEQRSLTNPEAAPATRKHLWPVFSAWDNGAGQRQVQVLSPFDIFFPYNQKVRQLWTPLFAIYRYSHKPDSSARHALLWNAVTYERSPSKKEFHLGPLFSVDAEPDRKRVAIGNGLFGFRRSADKGWRPFLFDFRMKKDTTAQPAGSP